MMKTYRGLQCGNIGRWLGRMVKLAVVATLLGGAGPTKQPPPSPPSREALIARARAVPMAASQAEAEDQVRAMFAEQSLDPDPDVTHWKYMPLSRVVDSGLAYVVLCGQLNTKNKFGGYTGWRYFALIFNESGTRRFIVDYGMELTRLQTEMCRNLDALRVE